MIDEVKELMVEISGWATRKELDYHTKETRKLLILLKQLLKKLEWVKINSDEDLPKEPFPEYGLPILMGAFDDKEPCIQVNIMWLFNGENWKELMRSLGYTHYKLIEPPSKEITK